MSISVPELRWTDARATEWTELIRASARELSERLGFRGTPPA